MIKAIIFDADHTLYVPRAGNAYSRKFEFLAAALGRDAGDIAAKWTAIVASLKSDKNPSHRKREYSTEKALVSLGVPSRKSKLLARSAVRLFWREVLKKLEPARGVTSVVPALSKDYALCIASDEFRESLELKLKKVFGAKWKKYFSFLVTPEDTKSLKPSAAYCETALRKLKLKPSQVLVVGDNWQRDLEHAKRRGMKTALLAEFREGEPDFHVRELSELFKVLSKLDKLER
ncbi:MAG TPA: HAD family hydrolase [archaeon]|nr:HAD family hydrolase [archaeon]